MRVCSRLFESSFRASFIASEASFVKYKFRLVFFPIPNQNKWEFVLYEGSFGRIWGEKSFPKNSSRKSRAYNMWMCIKSRKNCLHALQKKKVCAQWKCPTKRNNQDKDIVPRITKNLWLRKLLWYLSLIEANNIHHYLFLNYNRYRYFIYH